MSEDLLLRKVLGENSVIAIVGLSNKPHRDSYVVGEYLQHHGFRIVPVNPMCDEILGETCYDSLEAVPMKIDMVDCFRRSELMPDIARSAVAIDAKCLWLQLGLRNDEARSIAEAAGLDVVEDKCTKIEYARLYDNN
ncbi:MAG: CoA-binding protein [Pseudomonadota bacterium]